MQHIYSTGQVARMLGLRPHQLEYAHASGLLAEPAFRFLNKRAYRADEVRRVASHFGIRLGDDLSVVGSRNEGV